jgi:UDP-N-acetyl-D-glucosamine dehydrogenase
MLPKNITATKFVQVSQNAPSSKSTKTNPTYKNLDDLITKKKAVIGVIGLGYVGLPLTVAFADAGYRVVGFDNNPEKVNLLNQGVSYVQDISTGDVAKHVKSGQFTADFKFHALKDCDIVVVCVPTPLGKTKDPDISYILAALSQIEQYFRKGQLVILESTTYPGTTREVLLPKLEEAGVSREGKAYQVGRDFFLAFSPERVDPGNTKYNVYNTPKVVGGITEECGDLAALFYSQVMEKVVRVSSPESAEMVKLLENTFRSVNIALVNEVAIMCEKLKIDCWEVIEAATTKPFGFMPFYPGPGVGGHCIPLDPSYLSWKLRSLNYTARFIELANAVNLSMPGFCVDKMAAALNEDQKAVKGSKILVVGVAYKKNIDDMRESPALDIIHLLMNRGAKVDYFDPFVSELSWEGIQMKSVVWTDTLGAEYDGVLVATDHSNVNYGALLRNARRIVDTRNAFRDFKDSKITKI